MASSLKPTGTHVPVYPVFPQKPCDMSPFSQSASFVHPILSGVSLCSSMLLCFLLSVRHPGRAGLCSCAQCRRVLLHPSVTYRTPPNQGAAICASSCSPSSGRTHPVDRQYLLSRLRYELKLKSGDPWQQSLLLFKNK